MELLLKKYRTLFDFAPVGLLTLNNEGVILEINLFCARMLGIDRPLLLNRNLRPFVTSETWPLIESWLAGAMENADKSTFEITLISANGSPCYVLAEGMIIQNHSAFMLTMLDQTYLRQADERMQTLAGKLHDLSAHIEAGMEQEKKRIAREIHDGLGSSLTALKMELSLLNRRLGNEKRDPEIEKHIRSMSALVEGTVDLVRKLATELRPEVLDELGLIAALRWYARDFGERTGITTGFSVYPKDFMLEPELSSVIFRIFQEIMNNAAKHSKATKVTIFLRKQQHLFLMRVRDKGIGINDEEASHKRSFGIIGMQERAKLQHGNIKITGARDKGTTIVLEIPI